MTPKSPLKIYLAALGYLALLTLLAGLVFHTADRPVLLGKYDASDVFIMVLLLAALAAWWPVLNFFFTESRLKHPPGPDVVVTPRAKRIGGAILAVIVLALLQVVARRRMKVEKTVGG
ncbi:MAG: hypothetical protein KA248_14290 [Kiritimatiellae bacterium]|nr:hypothetical protein [Kiritimatiellia bacterium]